MNIPLNIDLQQILLHMFNFTLLTAGLYFILFKPVKQFMDKREKYYQDREKEAKEVQEQAEALHADYQKKLFDVEQQILEQKANAVKELEAIKERELKNAKEEAKKLLISARTEANREKDKILDQAREDIATLATEAAYKMVYASVSDSYDGFLSAVEGSVLDEQS